MNEKARSYDFILFTERANAGERKIVFVVGNDYAYVYEFQFISRIQPVKFNVKFKLKKKSFRLL